ncbi:hypothetical protein B0I32_1606 [Nonomuraea fuscirosea]|uniref:Uncharacterized protein n=1 Tax=Nonomuraea fuscirosea TaxID=1291556 RepID=A0A2T0LK25_9ACTN|nr:hypothetical protein [Nonomuraea fuscirosea]PRX43100.1 hypothetical protein B0I32_1606 [Nonomuraea fuscirosea]
MSYTEEQLRAALAESVASGSPDVQQIVRRGRRIKRRRRAGFTLAGLGAAATVFLGVQGVRVGTAHVAEQPPARVTASAAPSLPPEDTRAVPPAPLIASQSSATMPSVKTVKFRPLSFFTSYTIVCTDPEAWVIIRREGGGGGMRRCGQKGASSHSSKESVPSGWLERTQQIEVWVLPADTPIHDPRRGAGSDPYAGCTVARKDVGWCDGKYLQIPLVRQPGALKKLVEETRSRPGAWVVGVYDRADATDPIPTATTTVTLKPTG